MTVPAGLSPELAVYLQDLEDRVDRLENPQGPTLLFPILSGNLNTANAAIYRYRQVYVTDNNIIAWSNGSHWFRCDTGAQIV